MIKAMDRPRPETDRAGTDPTRPTPPPAPAWRQWPPSPTALVLPGGWQIEGLPATIRRAGPQAAERTVEFFTAQIRNPHTRAAYAAAVTQFFIWCDARGLALAELSPIAVATYIEEMHSRYRAPTIKQHLAAIRRHARRGLLPTGQALVAAAPGKRRQAPRPSRSTTRPRPISTRPGSRPRKTRPCDARCRGPAGWARAG